MVWYRSQKYAGNGVFTNLNDPPATMGTAILRPRTPATRRYTHDNIRRSHRHAGARALARADASLSFHLAFNCIPPFCSTCSGQSTGRSLRSYRFYRHEMDLGWHSPRSTRFRYVIPGAVSSLQRFHTRIRDVTAECGSRRRK